MPRSNRQPSSGPPTCPFSAFDRDGNPSEAPGGPELEIAPAPPQIDPDPARRTFAAGADMSVQDGAIVGDPAWTEYRKKNGLDPLGMQNSSVNLYQTFLPGVSNVTLRMRYYGLYAWLCRTYAQRNGDTDPASWRRVVRRAEAIYALTAQQHGGEGGVAGIEWAQRILATESDPIEFAPSTDPARKDGTDNYLAQEWGAYGAAYRSQLAEIGILGEVPGHDLPAPTPEMGNRLADAFAEAVGSAAEHYYDVVQSGRVTRTQLDQFGVMAPSKIGIEGAERSAYEDLLLNPRSPRMSDRSRVEGRSCSSSRSPRSSDAIRRPTKFAGFSTPDRTRRARFSPSIQRSLRRTDNAGGSTTPTTSATSPLRRCSSSCSTSSARRRRGSRWSG